MASRSKPTAPPIVARISDGVTFKKNPDRFIVLFKDCVMRLAVNGNTYEAECWRLPGDPKQWPMSELRGNWRLSAKDQNFVDAIMIAGVKQNEDA